MLKQIQPEIDSTSPRHIGIIIDGNRRWAKKRGLPALVGHAKGIKNVKRIVFYSQKKGIKFLTLYGFSVKNWERSKKEVDHLMEIFEAFIDKNIKEFHKRGIQLRHLGVLDRLPTSLQKKIRQSVDLTKHNQEMILSIALSYGGRDEIKRMVQKLVESKIKAEEITEEVISQSLDTKNLPDPDLIIRTSGEQRLSGFLIWQAAYAEFYFPEICWPDFDTEKLDEAILVYKRRQRRFGK